MKSGEKTETWIQYDWHIGKREAVFSVDASLLPESQKPTYEYLLHLTCASEDGELSGGERRRCERILKKCQKAFNPVFAGSISTESEIQYFFYVAHGQLQLLLDGIIGRERRLRLSYSVAVEKKWQTYRKHLYPDAAKTQTIDNGRLIESMRKSGDILTTPRKMNFYVFFTAEPMLLAFLEPARMAGFALGSPNYVADMDAPYGIILHRVCRLDKRELDSTTTPLVRLISKYDGFLINIDCRLIPRKA